MMETDRVVTKSQRIAELLRKTARGLATVDDRMELQLLVLRSDDSTLREAYASALVEQGDRQNEQIAA
jgi:hypothetical protein